MKKIVLLLALLFLVVTNSYSVEDKVVAIVNNEVITKAELDSYINMLKLRIGYEEWTKSGMTEKKALESMMDDRLVLQEAKNKKIEIEERLVDSRLQKMRSRFKSEDEFLDFLMYQGISLSELRENVKEQMLSEKLITMEVRNKIFISPAEVTKYYQDHLSDFYAPESAQLESIFIQDKQEAQKIYTKLKQGADFAQLQKEYSKRSNFGTVKKGELRKEIDDAIFKLDIGKFSTPVEISEGYYIFFVSNKSSPSQEDLVEVQDRIRDILSEIKFNTKLNEWFNHLKGKSYIVIKDE